MQTLNSGDWALITGASSGLGVEFAHILAARHMNLVLAARGVAEMERLADTLRSAHRIEVVVEGVDLSLPGAAADLKRRTDGRGLRIDTLINNAGFGLHGPLLGADPVRLPQMLQLNMVTLTELTQQYARDMVGRGRGRILLVASLLGYMPAPCYAAYAGTKHYVLALGEALHDELAPAGVTVTVLSPGVTKTAFFEGSGHQVSATLNVMMMAPRPVAEAGIRALMQGRTSVVPGLANKLSAWSARITPRRVQRRIMEALLA